MDVWFLLIGGALLALGTILAAIGRAEEMNKPATRNEVMTSKLPGRAWEDVAIFVNMFGAFCVAFGAMLSILEKAGNKSQWPFWIYFGTVSLSLALVIWVTIRRRKLIREFAVTLAPEREEISISTSSTAKDEGSPPSRSLTS